MEVNSFTENQKKKNTNRIIKADNTTVQLTNFREASSRYTSAMSATHSNLVTDDNSARAARTIVALLAEAHGSSANSLAATRIESPDRNIGTQSMQELFFL